MVLEREVRQRSVQEQPVAGATPGSSFFLQMASVADAFPEWGRQPVKRDEELRKFYPTEPILMSALYSIVIRNAAFSWTLEGPPRTVKVIQEMLHMADLGGGWLPFIEKIATDLFTQDNGAFIEIIRATEERESAVIGIAHLDAARCTRTGDPETPVVYKDRKGKLHRMKAHQVLPLSEFPAPIETMNGMQYCAVTRILRAAQIMKDISIYQREKLSGNTPNSLFLVGGGIKSSEISDAIRQHKDLKAEEGMIRYIAPVVIASLDPTAPVSMEQIDLKSLPDGFDFEEAERWYINQLALGFGADYQDFAPLPGKGLGTSTQSLVLHEKSRGRGPAAFMKMMEYAFNFHGIIPQNVQFKYDEQDVMADTEQAELNKTRSETLTSYVKEGILDPQAARQILLDNGDLAPEIFDRMNEGDVTPGITVPGEEKPAFSSLRPLPSRTKQQVEAVSDFAEDERLGLEADYERRIGKALNNAFKRAKKLIGVKSLPNVPGFKYYKNMMFDYGESQRIKQGPEDLLTDSDFWEEFRVEMVSAGGEFARKGALEAAEFNLNLGLAVDMDLVNEQVLDFSRRYTSEWWQRLEGTTRANLNKAVVAWQESGLGRRGFPDLVNSIEPMFGKVRAQRIATTEVTRIFDEGNRLAHESAGIEQEEWQTAKDLRVDDICRPLDGKKFPTNGGPRPVTDTHIGCVLPNTRVIARGVERAYRAWYEGPVLELAFHEGERLTLTPNHPVLTPSGWVAAEFLRPGGDVVCGPFGKGEVALGSEDITNRPPLIKEVFAALPMVRRVLSTATEFHGDGRFMDGDIDIVGSDSELGCACGSPDLQPLHQEHFIGRAVSQGRLIGRRVLGLFLWRSLAASHRFVRCLREVVSSFRWQAGHALIHSLRPIAGGNPSLSQAFADQAAGHIETTGQRELRLSLSIPRDKRSGVKFFAGTPHSDMGLSEDAIALGQRDGESFEQVKDRCPFPVRLDQIVSVVRREYAGHVYDLQTDTSLYQAAGVIVHNCRCARLPVGGDGRAIGK